MTKKRCFIIWIMYMLIWFFLLLQERQGEPGIFMGIARVFDGEINQVDMGKWFLLVLPPILVSELYLNNEIRISLFSLLRYSSFRSWWQRRMWMVICNTLLYMATGFCICRPWTTVLSVRYRVLLFILCTVHLLFLQMCVCYINLLTRHATQPVLFVALTEGISYIASVFWSEATPYLPGVWGMYNRSSIVERENGFHAPVVLLVQLVVIVFVMFFNFCFNKRLVTSRLVSAEEEK